ncbi:helix-turn-helix domain-containing protein [Ornithinibacillus sp. BX22]|uniref:Helix-turn-helix domain-containing protein n=2 Tax=Ornithinibacillus TaxID=484508 RepID=A0A923L8I0_9BACI|nr:MULTISPECIES: Rgg/GadR/MutR family transcriptional regulator [Ornithinibacillus]MBC5638334.1 helix-turn-helix domain-containing protein [Ornithinibacillus hominis]MBS3680885.1 helix-turn-helix domain-containing protein [Ornithinibacillus massiliensis]
MRSYGETFRIIRKQKGVTMKELADGVCSISFLSKFERGDSDITLGIFTRILDKLMLSMDEFIYVHHDYQPSQLEQFFQLVNTAYTSQNSDRLKQLKNQEMKKWERYGIETYYFNVLMLEVYDSMVSSTMMDENVNKAEIDLLTDYLFRVEVWGYYELALYSATMFFLDPGVVIQLSKTAYIKSSRYQELKKARDTITAILINTITYLIGPVNRFPEELTYEQEITEFFSYLDAIQLPEDKLFERLKILQLKGALELKLGNKESGEAKLRQTIQILRDLGSVGNANNTSLYLEQILSYIKISNTK